MGGHGLGVACGHIKALASFLSHIKENSVLKACRADNHVLSMLGRTTARDYQLQVIISDGILINCSYINIHIHVHYVWSIYVHAVH